MRKPQYGSEEKKFWIVFTAIILISILIIIFLFFKIRSNLIEQFRIGIKSDITFLANHSNQHLTANEEEFVADLIHGWGTLNHTKISEIKIFSPDGHIYAEYNSEIIPEKYEIFKKDIKNGNKLTAILQVKADVGMIDRKVLEYILYFGVVLFILVIFLGYIITLHIKRRRRAIELLSINKEMRKFITAFEQSPSCILITDLNGNIEYVNPQFSILTGYSLNETHGRNPKMLKSGKVAPEVYVEMWDTIKNGNIWRGELMNRKKNGELYWEEAVIGPVKDEKGELINYIAVKMDITDWKNAQKELEKHKENLEVLIRERTKELEEKNQKLTEVNKLFIGREMKIKELNLKLNSLKDEQKE